MKRSSAAGIVSGIFVIAFGVLALGNGLFSWNFHISFTEFWALVIVAVSIVSIVHRGFRFWNVVFLLVGGIIFVGDLGYYIRHPVLILASAVLIVLGIWIIKNAVTGAHFKSCNCSCSSSGCPNPKSEGFYDNKDFIKYENSFCEINIKNSSSDLKGGRVSIAFGKMCIDLTDVKIQSDAVLDVSSTFGTVEIAMPRGISYKTEVTPVFGSFINNAPLCQPVNGAPCLTIKGSAVFGTCTLK